MKQLLERFDKWLREPGIILQPRAAEIIVALLLILIASILVIVA